MYSTNLQQYAKTVRVPSCPYHVRHHAQPCPRTRTLVRSSPEMRAQIKLLKRSFYTTSVEDKSAGWCLQAVLHSNTGDLNEWGTELSAFHNHTSGWRQCVLELFF